MIPPAQRIHTHERYGITITENSMTAGTIYNIFHHISQCYDAGMDMGTPDESNSEHDQEFTPEEMKKFEQKSNEDRENFRRAEKGRVAKHIIDQRKKARRRFGLR